MSRHGCVQETGFQMFSIVPSVEGMTAPKRRPACRPGVSIAVAMLADRAFILAAFVHIDLSLASVVRSQNRQTRLKSG